MAYRIPTLMKWTFSLVFIIMVMVSFRFDSVSNMTGFPDMRLHIDSHFAQEQRIAEMHIKKLQDNDDVNILKSKTPWPVHNKTSNSYRARNDLKNFMETNKVNDDYNYCPRIEPFQGPFNYSSYVKNPCWTDKKGVFRCLPYFYLAGFSKCGTSDLFYRISLHPELVMSGMKEKHWFDYQRLVEIKRHIENYTDMFVKATLLIQKDMTTHNGFSNKIIGDGTPCYVWGSLNWPCYEGNEGLSEPLYTNADLIYRLNPKSKIIIMLREPVARLYSRTLTWIDEPVHPVYKNATPEKFHSFIEQRIFMYRDCFKRWSVRHCAYNGTLYKEAMLRLMEGVYSVYLKDWFDVFPRDQLLVLRIEDYKDNLAQTLKKVFEFLEMSPLPEEKLKNVANGRIRNKGKHYNIGPILNETVAILQKFYGPFNAELTQLLGHPVYK